MEAKEVQPSRLKLMRESIKTGFVNFFRILVVYLGYYGLVVLLVAGMYYVFLHDDEAYHDDHHMSSDIPESIISDRPGMSFFPLPPGDHYNVFTIWYNRSTPQHTRAYTQQLLDIINKEYLKPKTAKYVSCNHSVPYDDGRMLENLSAQRRFCKVYDHGDLDWGHVCTPYGNETSISLNKNLSGPFELGDDAFGFKRGSPCIMVRLNRINFWKPSTKGLTPEKKNRYKKAGITIRPDWEKNVTQFKSYESYIWIYCDGLTEEDREHSGDIAFFPRERPAIPKIYFPYTSNPSYLAPFIFIQFLNPTVNTLIRIRCIAFDNNFNIEQYSFSAVGTINFEVLID